MAQKIQSLDVEETSGVDKPAHLDNGFIIVKQAEAKMPEETGPTTEELTARIAELEATIAETETEAEVEPTVPELVKEAGGPVSKAFDDMSERLEKAEALLKAAGDATAEREAVALAKSFDLIQVETKVAKQLADLPEVVEILRAADIQMKAANLMRPVGTSGDDNPQTATEKHAAAAKTWQEANPGSTIEKAKAETLTGALFAQMKKEN